MLKRTVFKEYLKRGTADCLLDIKRSVIPGRKAAWKKGQRLKQAKGSAPSRSCGKCEKIGIATI